MKRLAFLIKSYIIAKRLIVLLVCISIWMFAMSQSGYRPMLKEGRVWVENSLYYGGGIGRLVFSVRIGGDTIINNMKYYRIYEKRTFYEDGALGNFSAEGEDYGEFLRCLMRESDSKRVYRYDNGTDVLLYDFSLPVGMKLARPGNYTQTVTSIDTIKVNDSSYRRMAINEINWGGFDWFVERGADPQSWVTQWMYDGYWVEGIGGSRGVTGAYKWTPEAGFIGASTVLLQACYDDDKLIFRASDFEHPGIHPMLKKGKEWVYDYYQFNDNEGKYNDPQRISYFIDGDTIINGKKYFTLVNTRKYPYPYCGAYREEGTTMYCVYPGQTEETVIQTFDPAGFPPEMAEFNTVQKDTIIVRDMPFVRYQYKAPKRDWALTAIEGVGFKDNGIVYGMSYGMPTCACDYMTLRYCIEDNCIIFTNEEFDTKQTDNIVQLRLAPSIQESNVSFFDLQGRRLSGKPTKGMYIQGGKKYVVK